MDLAAEGEFGLIRRIQSQISVKSKRVRLGIGDDAALLTARPGWELVLTTDSLVEHIHYDLTYTPLDALGWKALAVSLSDVAAMGGLPVGAVISLGIPESWTVEMTDALYSGLEACAQIFGCPIAGGDVVRVPRDSVLTVTVTGEVEAGRAILRSGAKPGDCVCVSGALGNARTGLEVLIEGIKDPDYQAAIDRFLRPEPRITEARRLLKNGGLTAMIDISDGLGSEIRHICEASRTGCRLIAEEIPVAQAARMWAEKHGRSPVDLGIESGEEYELLFTIQSKSLQRLESQGNNKQRFVRKIGEIISEDQGIILSENHQDGPLEIRGWDHFRS